MPPTVRCHNMTGTVDSCVRKEAILAPYALQDIVHTSREPDRYCYAVTVLMGVRTLRYYTDKKRTSEFHVQLPEKCPNISG